MRVGILTLALAASGCGAGVAHEAPVESPAECGIYGPPHETGHVQNAALDEVSGIVASRAHPGVLWAHNDSGDGPRLFAIDAAGGASRGEWVLEGASARDWEDVAIEVIDDAPDRLWIGDVGDNGARNGRIPARDSVVVLRVDEPEPLPSQEAQEAARPLAFDTIVLRYPDRPRDAEAIAIDPASGDLLVLAKEDAGASDVFVARAPFAGGEVRMLELLATIDLASMITATDVSPDGRELIVRTYRDVSWWRRDDDEGWADALARPALLVPHADEPQGEAIAFTARGDGYYTISEGDHPPIWLTVRCPRAGSAD
ncbi:hypothetical protein [Sandaracinus amylolyticus]|uniref:Integral membrane protein n=1 Tax=Sandaracinus amylolyticus TaxID=927083 RepID=A0A0F6W797_9BACT|nr:hypothetical protein [Sandaracinus amylolyticus]AKF09293.1 hypothetical protein DB32_006442 [Sandaracinus amylolyticus]